MSFHCIIMELNELVAFNIVSFPKKRADYSFLLKNNNFSVSQPPFISCDIDGNLTSYFLFRPVQRWRDPVRSALL